MAEDIQVVISHVHAADLDGAGPSASYRRGMSWTRLDFALPGAADDAQRLAGFDVQNVISFSTGWPEPCLY